MATALEADPTRVMGRRVVASVIDGAVIVVPGMIVASSQVEYFELNGRDGDRFCDAYVDQTKGVCVSYGGTAYFDDGPAGLVGWGIAMGLAVLLLVVVQGLTGWTVGKRATGIRTVREDGRRPGLGKALVRWLMWVIDGLPFLGLVGFITGLTTVGHRRVGDMVAKTFVVRAGAAGSPIRVGDTGSYAGAPPPGPASGSRPWTTTSSRESWGAPPAPTAKPGPQWDEARGTYIQRDPAQTAWMRWDDGAKVWEPIASSIPEIPDPPIPDPPAP